MSVRRPGSTVTMVCPPRLPGAAGSIHRARLVLLTIEPGDPGGPDPPWPGTMTTHDSCGLPEPGGPSKHCSVFAVDIGQVQSDDNGISGQSVIHLFRLLQSAALKHALAMHNADIAFVASEYVYQEILQYEYDNAAYEPVDVQVKETITRAWLRVFGTAVARREALNGRNRRPRLAATSSGTAGLDRGPPGRESNLSTPAPFGHIVPDHVGDRGTVFLILAPRDHLHIAHVRAFISAGCG